jgi:phage-related minor tail protein
MALNVGELYAQLSLESGEFDKGVQGVKGQMGKLGGMVAGAFAGVMAGAVAALGGAMVAGVKGVNDYKKAMNGLQTQTGATQSEMESMGDAIKNIYGRNFGESFQDIGDTMAFAKQATGAVGEELEYLTQDALMLRDTFQMDVTESLRGADSLMEQFGATGTEAMAYIAEATQKGLNKNGDLVDTIEEYSVYFENAGMSAQDMFGILENASAAGVRNLDFVGDAMKEFGIIMKEDGDKATNALNDMGLNAEELRGQFAKGGEGAKAAFQTIMNELGSIEDPLKRNQLGVELFGTKFEDLEADAVLAMGNLNGTIKGSVDTLNEINEIKYDDFGTAMQGIGRQLMVGLIMPLGEKLLPHLNKFANWIASKLPAIQEFFKRMGQVVSDVFGRFSSKLSGAGDTFDKWKGMLVSGFQTVVSVVGPLVTLVGQKIMDVFGSVVSWWNTNGSSLLENVMIVFNGIWNVIKFIMPAVLAVVSMVFDSIKGVITGALNIISGVFSIFAGLFTGNWSKMWEGVKTLVSGAIQFIWNLWNLMLVGRLVAGIKLLGSKSLGLFKSMWTGIQNGFNRFVTWIGNLITKLVTGTAKNFTSMVNRAIQIFTRLRQIGFSIFQSIKQAIYNIILDMVKAVTSRISSMSSTVSSKFSGILSKAKSIFASIKNAIMNPIKTAKDKVVGWINDIKSAFRNFATKIKVPHFNVSNFSLNPKDWVTKGLPSISVDWYKTGGIATGPAVAGIGEAGSEAIVPLAGRRMLPFSQSIAEQMAGLFGNMQPAAAGGGQTVVKMYINDREFAEAITDAVTEEQERTKITKERGRGKRRS